jgi:hypothetical protein
MSEPPDTSVIEAPGDDWLTSSSAPADGGAAGPAGSSSRRQIAVRAGLLAVGAAAGALVVTTVAHGSSTPTTPVANAGAQGPLGANGGPGGPPPGGFPGGRAGEQHLTGTLTSVGASSVTVTTASGTATYAVTSATQIIRNGNVSSLAALRSGDSVFVHVYPTGSTDQLTAERIFAAASTATGDPT